MSHEQMREMRTALIEAKEIIDAQNEEIERLTGKSLTTATVVGFDEVRGLKYVQLSTGNGVAYALAPKDIKLNVGDTVGATADTLQVVGFAAAAAAAAAGEAVPIVALLPGERAEITTGSEHRVIMTGKFEGKLKIGDRVLLDKSQIVVTAKLPNDKKPFDFAGTTGIEWHHVGGQVEAKRQMIEAVELPFKNPKAYGFYGKKPIKGIMLYGPPGCGKTLLAKAAATAIANAVGKTSGGFMYIKGPEILDPYVGVTEANIRNIFKRARDYHAEHGVPAVVFIDEADAILGKRGTRSIGMEQTIVPMFLAEMDGLEASNALVILTTNRPDMLDPAITREGRIDRKVRVSRPTLPDVEEILRINLGSMPLDGDINELVAVAATALFDESYAFYSVTLDHKTEKLFTLADIVSGALVAGVVDQAASLAMHRDIAANARKPSGINQNDLLAAVVGVYRQNRDVDHADALNDLTAGQPITNLRKHNHAKAA
jgi:proteasome-associated ATPase